MPPARHDLVTVLSLLALLGCADEPDGRPGGFGGPIKVVTHTLEAQPIVDEIQALGTARANESVEIRPRVASLVTPHRRGVGPMTITMLLHNTLTAYETRTGACPD